MDFDFSRLLTLHYFLDRNPGGDFLIGYALLVFFILVIFARPIILKFTPENKYFRKSARRKFGKFVFLGILGVIFVSARFSTVPVFSMRLLLWLTFLLVLLFGVQTLLRIRKEYRTRIEAVEREKRVRGER